MRILGAASAAATSFPALAAVQQGAAAAAAPAQATAVVSAPTWARCVSSNADTVIISSNENPLGPAQSALAAISKTAPLGGRYHMDETMKTVKTINEQYGLKKGYVALTPGSGGPLDLALMSNIGPDKPLVYGDPSYEQGPAPQTR